MGKIFAVPKEIKTNETRVALTPDAVFDLTNSGYGVIVETLAGELSGFSDDDYIKAGAKIIQTPKELWEKGDYIIKVKEPQESEFQYLKEDQVIFSYFHLAVDEKLTDELLKKKVCAIASESVETENKDLPLLRPMSEVAGRMCIQIASRLLEKQNGGSGVLLSGVPGVESGRVVVVGAGSVGLNAAKQALGIGAQVVILDINQKRLSEIDMMFNGKIQTRYCNTTTIMEEAKKADVLIGAVLIPSKKAPKLISENVIKNMKKGSVVVDVAIDQGGITETIDKTTTYDEPAFEKHGVLHCAIPNIPSAVPQTSSRAYSSAILPYVKKLAELGTVLAIRECESLMRGVNTFRGEITCEALADSLKRKHTEISALVGFKVE